MLRALLGVAGLFVLAPPIHFDVSAAFTAKAAGKGEVAVTFTPKDPDVHINQTPAPRLKLEAGQAVQEILAPEVRESGPPSGKYLDTAWPVVFPVTVARAKGPVTETIKGTLTYFYCSRREGWCRKGTADVEFPARLP